MKIKTLENLEDALNKHLAWRKKEMITLKVLIDKGNETHEILIRAGLALLCAHFEGFIKDASNDYLEYIANQNVTYQDLQDVFSVIKLHHVIEEASKSPRYSVQLKILREYEKLSTQKFHNKKSEKTIVNTHSNPSTAILKELLLTLGLSTDIFNTKAIYIDNSLLSNRHKIVHGEKYTPDDDDFSETFRIIMELLDSYKRVVIEAAEKESYKKQGSS